MKRSEEKFFKRCLKRKIPVTLGVIISFLISGTILYGNEVILKYEDNMIKIYDGENLITNDSYGKVSIENGKFIWVNKGIINSEQLKVDSSIPNNKIDILLKNNGSIFSESKKEYNGNGILIQASEDIISEAQLQNFENNGIIVATPNLTKTYMGNGVFVLVNKIDADSSTSLITNLNNSGVIIGNSKNNYSGNAILAYSDSRVGISKIDNIINIGIISGYSKEGSGIINYSGNGIFVRSNSRASMPSGSLATVQNLFNGGIIFGYSLNPSDSFSGNGIATYSTSRNESPSLIKGVNNKGIISGKNETKERSFGNGILSYSRGENLKTIVKATVEDLVNRGIISGESKNTTNNKSGTGIISYSEFSMTSSLDGLKNLQGKMENITNLGVVAGSNYAISIVNTDSNGQILLGNLYDYHNYGIIIGKELINANYEESNKKITNKQAVDSGLGLIIDENKNITSVIAGAGGKVESKNENYFIVNAFTQGETSSNLNNTNIISSSLSNKISLDFKNSDSNSYKNLILNGVENTLVADGEISLNNSILNSYGTALKLETGEKFSGENLIINGNIFDKDTSVIVGNEKDNQIILSGESVINGDIDLSGNNDNDILTFGNSNSQDENINIFHDIKNTENINVEQGVTFYESSKITNTNNIVIGEKGKLVLRIDTTNNNSHALSDNNGVISSNGGKLIFALNGLGDDTEIDVGNTLDTSMKGSNSEGIEFKEDLTLDTTSYLHSIERINGNDSKVKVVAKINLPSLNDKPENPYNYDSLNKIYQSILVAQQDGEFTEVTKDKYGSFLNYLHDVYTNSPYSFSTTLSRKSVNMFSDVVMGKDLHPEVNKWTIYGGLTHIDGGTKDTYYGKGYYTYDIGSKDIDVDSKITGMYAQGEYGVNETLNLGVIFGGNQSESEINSNSKVEGDSFYLGAYAKKYLGNLRLLAGVGYQYGDYKADRMAVGYDGITTTRTFDSNYNDNTFNIYAQAKYSNKLAENLYLEPSVALDYTYINQDGASEDGVLAIETDDKNFNYTTAKFGVDLRKDIPTTSAIHSLVAGTYYNRMLDGYEEENITGRFVGGSDFDILVSPSNKHELGLRAKYEVELNNGVTFDVKGSYTFARESYSGENKNEHKGEWLVGVGIGYKF